MYTLYLIARCITNFKYAHGGAETYEHGSVLSLIMIRFQSKHVAHKILTSVINDKYSVRSVTEMTCV
jgi:hypothetical protein